MLFTWISNNSRGSLALAVAFHATFNSVFPFLLFPDRQSGAALRLEELSTIPPWACALLVILAHGATTLRKGPWVPS